MRTVFVHLHIPKSGGSTVRHFLNRNFRDTLKCTNGILNDYQYNSEQIARIIDHHPKLKCLTGHKISLDLPYDRAGLKLHAFTWVRDPVDRFVSHYFFHRHHTDLVLEAKKMDLETYAKWALRDGNQRMYINGQTRFLSGGNLDTIKQAVVDDRLMLFPLSRMEDSLRTLRAKFPDCFRYLNAARKKNVSRKDQSVSPGFREQVLPYVEDDLELLAMAEQTPLVTQFNSHLTKANSLTSVARDSAEKLGRLLVRCGNSLSRVG